MMRPFHLRNSKSVLQSAFLLIQKYLVETCTLENIMDACVYLRSHGSASLGFSSETNQLGANVTDVFGFASYPVQLLISVHWCRGEEWSSAHRHTSEFTRVHCQIIVMRGA